MQWLKISRLILLWIARAGAHKRNIFLTNREMEVLNAMFQEFTMKDIATKLNISVRTLEKHKAHLQEKTKTKNSLELILFAIKSGLLDINILIQ